MLNFGRSLKMNKCLGKSSKIRLNSTLRLSLYEKYIERYEEEVRMLNILKSRLVLEKLNLLKIEQEHYHFNVKFEINTQQDIQTDLSSQNVILECKPHNLSEWTAGCHEISIKEENTLTPNFEELPTNKSKHFPNMELQIHLVRIPTSKRIPNSSHNIFTKVPRILLYKLPIILNKKCHL